MLDIKWIKDNPQKFHKLLVKRGMKAELADEIIALDREHRRLTSLIQELQHARKLKSKELAAFADKKSQAFNDLKRDGEYINEKLKELVKEAATKDVLKEKLEIMPNLPADDVPEGMDEESNMFVRNGGGDLRDIQNPLAHEELGYNLSMMDFTQTAKMSGNRFVTLSGDLAKMERALINFMLDVHTKQHDFLEVSPPSLVRPSAMYNAGQLPKFADESFLTTSDHRLIPTGEVPLINMVADTIIEREKLPLRYTAFTPCYRSEAGSAGRDTRGMIRMHQFSKIELVSITTPEEAEDEHEFMLGAAEYILKALELPYRVMLLCAGDMGFAAKKTYDLEVWMPSQKKYREISSCSNCGDFQARRMKARYKEFGADNTTYVHILNASGLAIGRTLIAIMENYQNSNGSIEVPKILRDYMGGMNVIDRVG